MTNIIHTHRRKKIKKDECTARSNGIQTYHTKLKNLLNHHAWVRMSEGERFQEKCHVPELRRSGFQNQLNSFFFFGTAAFSRHPVPICAGAPFRSAGVVGTNKPSLKKKRSHPVSLGKADETLNHPASQQRSQTLGGADVSSAGLSADLGAKASRKQLGAKSHSSLPFICPPVFLPFLRLSVTVVSFAKTQFSFYFQNFRPKL